jgi:hypothetical protein
MWKTCTMHPGYEVSFDGRIRNCRTLRVLKPQQAKSGRYAKVNLGHHMQAQVHQIVAEAWHPKPLTGMPLVVDHIDNQGTRNCVTNLRWLTYSMNTRQWYAMNAACEAAGRDHGWDLHPVMDPGDWEPEFERLRAAGL